MSGGKTFNSTRVCICDAPKVVRRDFDYGGKTITIELCAGCRDDPDFPKGKDERILK